MNRQLIEALLALASALEYHGELHSYYAQNEEQNGDGMELAAAASALKEALQAMETEAKDPEDQPSVPFPGG